MAILWAKKTDDRHNFAYPADKVPDAMLYSHGWASQLTPTARVKGRLCCSAVGECLPEMESLCPLSRRFRRSSQLGADIARRCVNCLSSPIASWTISAFAAAISSSSCAVPLRAKFRPDREILKSPGAPGNWRAGLRGGPRSRDPSYDNPRQKPLTAPGSFVTSAP